MLGLFNTGGQRFALFVWKQRWTESAKERTLSHKRKAYIDERGEFECLDLNYVSGLDVFGSWTEDYRKLSISELKDALAAKYISYLDSLEE